MSVDLVLTGGWVHDGLGNPPARADVAIADGRIAAIGPHLRESGRVLDVDGLVVSPGFVDAHAHSDMLPFDETGSTFKLEQGVTTEINGNCGFSMAPLDEQAAGYVSQFWGELANGTNVPDGSFGGYLDRLEASSLRTNVASMVGHNTLRLTANGTEAQLKPGAATTMARLLDEACRAGAVGFSTGLLYPPGAYASTGEVIRLATVAGTYGLTYATHMRDEAGGVLESLDEAITIGRRAGVRVQISHCKVMGLQQHGSSATFLQRLHDARRTGIDIRGDVYPYRAGSTFLAALLPSWTAEHGMAELAALCAAPPTRDQLRSEAQRGGAGMGLWALTTPDDVLVVRHCDSSSVGRTVAELAARHNSDAFDCVLDLLTGDPSATMVIATLAEQDVRTIMRDPLIAIGSDNGPPRGMQHPRTWGCFPRVLGAYVREAEVLELGDAIRKMTSGTADHFGLVGRGRLSVGAAADITVFDPETIGHSGTYSSPDARPTGIEHVIVNGVVAIRDGSYTGAAAGHVLRR